MFSLENQKLKIRNVNARNESHGEKKVLSVDINVTAVLMNRVLNEFDRNLKTALYWKGEDQQESLNLEEDNLPALRFPEMSPFQWSKTLSGYKMKVHIGISGFSDIDLDDCKLLDFKFSLISAIAKKDGALLLCKNTAHSILIAGGDYGDELSDYGLRKELTKARDTAELALSTKKEGGE